MKQLIYRIIVGLFCAFVFCATYTLNKFDLGLSSFRFLNPIAPITAVMVVLFILFILTDGLDDNQKIAFTAALFLFFVIVGIVAYPHYKTRASLRDYVYEERPDGIQITFSDSEQTNSISLSESDVHSILGNLQNIYSNDSSATVLQPAEQ